MGGVWFVAFNVSDLSGKTIVRRAFCPELKSDAFIFRRVRLAAVDRCADVQSAHRPLAGIAITGESRR